MQMLPRVSRQSARGIIRWAKKQGDAGLLIRAQIVASLGRGRRAKETADLVGSVRSHVYRTARRFRDRGRDGLLDGRRDNGRQLATAAFDQVVLELISGSPLDGGFKRPTWTRELLVRVAAERTGVRVSLTVMGRVLRRLGARRGRPKPTVACPLSERHRRRRLAKIRALLSTLRDDEVAVYEDEIDIHLNPKIGVDWMPRGVQKEVLTPGKNAKAYVAGALDVRSRNIVWVGGSEKTSTLFVALLDKLHDVYRGARLIHVVLDNFGIHYSHETRRALRRLGRIRLHFLPPYCPEHNAIERFWQDLHANVTRNHKHAELGALCGAVAEYLDGASPWLPKRS